MMVNGFDDDDALQEMDKNDISPKRRTWTFTLSNGDKQCLKWDYNGVNGITEEPFLPSLNSLSFLYHHHHHEQHHRHASSAYDDHFSSISQ